MLNEFISVAAIVLGLIGLASLMIVVAVFRSAKPTKPVTTADLVTQAANADAADFLAYLENSECNLYFNPVINAWGLVDGKDNLIAAGHSVRAALSRARQKDADELDQLAIAAALDFNKAEQN